MSEQLPAPTYQDPSMSGNDAGYYIQNYGKNQEDKRASIIKELKLSSELEIIEMKLRGYTWDILTQSWNLNRSPEMNEEGIGAFMQALNTASDAVTLSYYKLEDVPSRVMFIMRQTVPQFHVKYKDYGIKDKSRVPFITAKLFTFTEACFRKGAGGGDRKVIKDTMFEDLSGRNTKSPESFMEKVNIFTP